MKPCAHRAFSMRLRIGERLDALDHLKFLAERIGRVAAIDGDPSAFVVATRERRRVGRLTVRVQPALVGEIRFDAEECGAFVADGQASGMARLLAEIALVAKDGDFPDAVALDDLQIADRPHDGVS
jgi:hypothetical protein